MSKSASIDLRPEPCDLCGEDFNDFHNLECPVCDGKGMILFLVVCDACHWPHHDCLECDEEGSVIMATKCIECLGEGCVCIEFEMCEDQNAPELDLGDE